MEKSNKKSRLGKIDPLKLYLKEIGNLPVLTSKEEKKLFKKIEKGDEEAKKKLARANLKLVVEIAKYYAPRSKKLTLLDLIHEGNLGLFVAAELYDWKSNYRFSTLATLIIRKGIFKSIKNAK